MKKFSEGRKMWLSVMGIFLIYSIIFILFEDYDRKWLAPFNEVSDWHLLFFTIAVLCGLAILLYHYARQMDQRIQKEQTERQTIMRRELTQNISHELKTPVASILGYMETILDNPDMEEKTRQQFIKRSHTQAEQLTALLQDLSTLNRMDYSAQALDREPTDISQIVKDLIDETNLRLAAKGMTFDNRLPDGITILGNASLLYGIFRNLTDNAINYAGERTVITLSAIELADRWMFSFSDNGIGVAEEHLPRLFERFYRIDKGRSRQMGGTGLGLAIVKNAVLLHGGTIFVRNNAGGGLCFNFGLKKK